MVNISLNFFTFFAGPLHQHGKFQVSFSLLFLFVQNSKLKILRHLHCNLCLNNNIYFCVTTFYNFSLFVRGVVDGFEHEHGPQERADLFTSIENQVEQLCEIMVVICDFIDDLEESQVSEASIKLFWRI